MEDRVDENTSRRLAFTNSLLFETPGGLRFTQDSPILPNVWLAFAEEPHRQHELILTSNRNSGTGQAAQQIREMLNNYRKKKKDAGRDVGKRPRVSYIPGQLAVRLYFDELMRVVVPLTQWWHETYDRLRDLQRASVSDAHVADWFDFPQPDPQEQRERDLWDALMLMRREIDPGHRANTEIQGGVERREYIRSIPPDLSWFVRISGLIAHCFLNEIELLSDKDDLGRVLEREFYYRRRDRLDPDLIEKSSEMVAREEATEQEPSAAYKARGRIVAAFTRLFEDWNTGDRYPTEMHIWQITKNRPIRLAVNKSALTVKADAAIRLFDITCNNITWAVVDSGIDPNHYAFKLHSNGYEREVRDQLESERQERLASNTDIDREEGELRVSDLKKDTHCQNP